MRRIYTLLSALLAVFILNTFEIQAAPLTYYELYIGGTQVNSGGLSSIRGRGIKGKISYNPKTKTLTLNNANISMVRGINGISNTGIDDLIINLIGENEINALGVSGIILNANTIITGEGSLRVTSDYHSGIYIQPNTTLTISGGTVEVKGKTGISGFDGIRGEKLVVTDATLKATGSPYGSLCNLTSLTLGGGCQIISPEGASFSSELHFVNQNGTRIITQVLITKPKEQTPPESEPVVTDKEQIPVPKEQISVDKEETAPVVTEPVATDEKQAVTE